MDPHFLPHSERVVLELLTEGVGRYGLELVALAHGRLKRGTVYVTLGRMEHKGFVASVHEPGSGAGANVTRRRYRITPYGRRVLQAAALVDRMLVPDALTAGESVVFD